MDLSADPFAYDLLAPNPNDAPVQSPDTPTVELSGASTDFSHVVYRSQTAQTAEPAPASPIKKLYDWHGGAPSLLSRDTADQPFSTSSELPGFAPLSASNPNPFAVRGGGERIFFDNPVNTGSPGAPTDNPGCTTVGCDLYLRESGVTTLRVSASECTVDCDPVSHSSAKFVWANSAGDIALFFSCDKLTDASTPFEGSDCRGAGGGDDEQAKLYRWDRFGTPTRQLIDLTADEQAADGDRPRAKQVIGASDDGEVVFFFARGQIVAGAPAGNGGPQDGLKLYRWTYNAGDPQVDYLGPYVSSSLDGQVNEPTSSLKDDPNVVEKESLRVTPDGEYLSILSRYPYDPAVDRDGDADVYRWDEGGGWLCISCQLPGEPSAGHADGIRDVTGFRPAGFADMHIVSAIDYSLSTDGKRIVFTTPDSLLPQDVNGEVSCTSKTNGGIIAYSCQDIYEWNDGTLSLLTPGTKSTATVFGPYRLIGTTENGQVFFETDDRLVGWDVDNGIDVYTARIGGGFPEPPAVPPACEGDACRGAGPAPSDIPGAGTRPFVAPIQRPTSNRCGDISKKAQRKAQAAKKAARRGQSKRARALRKQASKLKRRARRCNRRAAS